MNMTSFWLGTMIGLLATLTFATAAAQLFDRSAAHAANQVQWEARHGG